MAHSAKYERVKYFYDNGFWDKSKVHDAVVKGWITAAEYQEITGAKYKE